MYGSTSAQARAPAVIEDRGNPTPPNANAGAVIKPVADSAVRKDEVIEAANDAGVTLYLTGARHFAH